MWGVEVSNEFMKYISRWIFNKSDNIDQILVYTAIQENIDKKCEKKNDIFIELPSSIEELELRLSSKGRYNIRREKKLQSQYLGIVDYMK